MSEPGFPHDTYTPHGYLANPYAVAHSWSVGEGSNLRSSRDAVGFGWQVPWALRAAASIDLVVRLEGGGRRYARRADFADTDLVSVEHSARVFSYQWQALGRTWSATYTLVEEDVLGLTVRWSPPQPPTPDVSGGLTTEAVTLAVALEGWRRDGGPVVPVAEADGSGIDLGAPHGRCVLVADAASRPPPTATVAITVAGPDGGIVHAAAIRAPSGAAPRRAVEVARRVPAALAEARADDADFWGGATRLAGDWPEAWRRGWVYDTETTRMCVFPAGGIFADVWPSWMIQWPRAVVAEGTLDMARFAYASPDLAQRALLSLFRDAQAPNVPCVFQHGEPNMVAKDGSVCGTSPAWCVPFYNLERLYAQTLDTAWLAAIYPSLERYVEWWLAERTDADGWAVYKCTWEAGEDDTPRLDPERRGDNVVSAYVRPVELQATMALSAGVLARFAAALERPDAAVRWRRVESDYAGRTQSLWDGAAGRYRDWDARAGRFQEPSGTENYWGVDVCRYSALAFTPVLAGLADDEQRAALRRELQEYAGPPWTLWASWSSVVLEAALHLDERAFAGRVADEIIRRVYTEMDTRTIDGPSHPTPGVAREFWPLDLADWASCEGYGWGANTAALLVRQIVGFVEGPYGDLGKFSVALAPHPRSPLTPQPPLPQAGEGELRGHSVSRDAAGRGDTALAFALNPALPGHLLTPGQEYLLTGLPYRGARLTVGYRVEEAPDAADGAVTSNDGRDGDDASGPDGTRAPDGGFPADGARQWDDLTPARLTLMISTDAATRCRVSDEHGTVVYETAGAAGRHEVGGRNGGAYVVELWPHG